MRGFVINPAKVGALVVFGLVFLPTIGRRPPVLKLCCALIMVLLSSPAWTQQPPAAILIQQLRSDIIGKTFLIRHFPEPDHLKFNAAGELQDDTQTGSWTIAKIRVSEIAQNAKGITIIGQRVIVVHHSGAPLEDRITNNDIELEIRGSAQDFASISAAQLEGKLFYSDVADAVQELPDYWKPILGLTPPREGHCPDPLVRYDGTGQARVSPPKVTSAPDPEFPKITKKLGVRSGHSVLCITVEPDGRTGTIVIKSPAGSGLDEAAVAAVRRWRFTPAKRGDVPIAVGVIIDISFNEN